MSRCFTYPPPGYFSNGVRGEAVRDPIKLKRGKENPITEIDKKKRRDKKQRKEKKDKKKDDKGNKELASKVDKYNLSQKSFPQKGNEEEAERSDLTEEHEQPVTSLNVCHSPDSSGRGNKRKLDNSGSITKAQGNILRIRLPLQRYREPDVSLRTEGLCSGSGNSESVTQQAETSTQCLDDCHHVTFSSEVGSKSVKSAHVAELEAKDNSVKTDSVPLHKKKGHKLESLYKSLVGDWIPPPLELDQSYCDDSWLHQLKDEDRLVCKRLKSSHSGQPCHKSSNLWPSASYIAEADVYALPYSMPF